MSRLNELIKELYPNGVEYKKIKDVYLRIKGTPITASKMKEIANENGEIRIFAGGKTVIDAFEVDIPKANITRVPAVLIQSRGVIDAIYYDKPFTFKNEMWAYTADTVTEVKYLYYVIKNNISYFRKEASGMGSLPQISLKVTEEFKIPVPPLEVQREIVRILDSFTVLIKELTAELTARKKQYEFYRNQLLSIDIDKFSISKLNEIADIFDGTHQTPDYKSEGIPFISVENINNIYSNTKFISEEAYSKYKTKPKVNDLFMTRIGTIGKCAIMTKQEDLAYYVSLALIRPQRDVIDSRYLKHYLESTLGTKELSKRTLHNAVPIKINKDDIGKIVIKYPSIIVQRKIADVLDNFEKICNDLTIGLPAEIEARQKQYEYYRDALLTFGETGTIIAADTRHQKALED